MVGGGFPQLAYRFPQFHELAGLLSQLAGMVGGGFPQLRNLAGVFRGGLRQLGYRFPQFHELAGLRGGGFPQFHTLAGILSGGFRQLACRLPQLADSGGQLIQPLGAGQQLRPQELVAEGFLPLGLLVQNAIQVGDVVDDGRAGGSHKDSLLG